MLPRNLPPKENAFSALPDGDETAFRRLFDTYRDRIRLYAYRLLKSREEADELVQETFISIWIKRDVMSSVEDPERYIFAMVRNKAIDHLRRIAVDRELRERVWRNIEAVRNVTQEEVLGNELEELTQKAFRQLSPHRQTVFHLSRVEGLTHQEIAVRLNISRNTVKNQMVASLKFIWDYVSKHTLLLLASAFIHP